MKSGKEVWIENLIRVLQDDGQNPSYPVDLKPDDPPHTSSGEMYHWLLKKANGIFEETEDPRRAVFSFVGGDISVDSIERNDAMGWLAKRHVQTLEQKLGSGKQTH